MTQYVLNCRQKAGFERFKRIGFDNAEIIVEKQVNFIREYHENAGLKAAIIGASGGIDSSYAIALAVKALGPENVIIVKMPFDAIRSSIVDSVRFADELKEFIGLSEENVKEVSILSAVSATVSSLALSGFPKPTRTQLGNLMARERMKILYHIASQYGGLVHDTCNKTEILFGYLTKHGDGASDLNALGDIYKTWIWEISRKLKLVPESIIDRIPSAELFEGQKDTIDMGIDYDPLDLFFHLYYELKIGRKRLARDYGFPKDIVDMIVNRVAANAHKSSPAPVCKIIF